MAEKGSAESRAASRSSINNLSTSLRLASGSGCQLSDREKRTVSKQLRDVRGPAHIPLEKSKLLMGLVGRNIIKYQPDGDEISYISSAQPL